MGDYLVERTLGLEVDPASPTLFDDIEKGLSAQLRGRDSPIRFAVTGSSRNEWCCDLGLQVDAPAAESLFGFRKRDNEDSSKFNAVMLVPTGIGAEVGGHAGDATPAATLLANVCDSLVTHPNVLNASDMIQIPPNVLYVEGSVITKMLMGVASLSRPRTNRVLVLVQSHRDRMFSNAAINSVNAARAYYGLDVPKVVMIDAEFRMVSEFSESGSAAGFVEGLGHVWTALEECAGSFDAVAISSVIEVPPEFHTDYYDQAGAMVNPWGGVEAMLTHAISLRYGVPAAHAPMFESREVAGIEMGIVDPRMAAEVVSETFLQSVLRGLQRSPRIVAAIPQRPDSLGVEDVSCLVIPDGCLGLPTLAALHQGIPVVAVRENENIMRNDLTQLPWKSGQFMRVENYWEAAGVTASLRAGLDPYSIRRPLRPVNVINEPSSRGAVEGILRTTRES